MADKTATHTLEDKVGYGTPCLICGEIVEISNQYDRQFKICDKCKAAVMAMRELVKQGTNADSSECDPFYSKEGV